VRIDTRTRVTAKRPFSLPLLRRACRLAVSRRPLPLPLAFSIVLHGAAFLTLFFVISRQRREEPPTPLTFSVDEKPGKPAAESPSHEVHPVREESKESAAPRIQSFAPDAVRKNAPMSSSPPQGASSVAVQTNGSDAGGSPSVRADYFLRVRERIEAKLEYPSTLRARRLQGRVELTITLDPSGLVRSADIARSSGHPELDRIALESARAASPFESFAGPATRSARVPIDFRIR
jgi:periplasmic protein TonB